METLFGLVVPNLHQSIISSGNKVRFVSLVVIHAIHTKKMSSQREVRLCSRSQIPNLDALIQRAAGESVEISGVECQLHHIMHMILQRLNKREVVVPIPDLDCGVVWRGKNVALCGVDHQTSNVVCVGVKCFDFLHCVIVKHSNLEVITATNQPLFPGDESSCSDWRAWNFKGFDCGLDTR